MNSQVDQLIGQESRCGRRRPPPKRTSRRSRPSSTRRPRAERAEGPARQGEGQLKAATEALEQLLVQIYKSGDPDVTAVVMRSADWSDLLTRTEYYDHIQNYDKEVVGRVRGLRDQVTALVNQLTDTHARIKTARDQVPAKEQQLATARTRRSSPSSRSSSPRGTPARRPSTPCSEGEAIRRTSPTSPRPPAARPSTERRRHPAPNAPLAVRAVIEAANQIDDLPYVWGGGHGSFDSSGYDCSGAVSFALHGGGFLLEPARLDRPRGLGRPGRRPLDLRVRDQRARLGEHRRAALRHRRPRRRQRPPLEHRDARRRLELRRAPPGPATRARGMGAAPDESRVSRRVTTCSVADACRPLAPSSAPTWCCCSATRWRRR